MFNGGLKARLLGYVFHLSISIGSFRDVLVPGMVSVFGGLHNLNTLEIKTNQWSCDREYVSKSLASMSLCVCFQLIRKLIVAFPAVFWV